MVQTCYMASMTNSFKLARYDNNEMKILATACLQNMKWSLNNQLELLSARSWADVNNIAERKRQSVRGPAVRRE